ncbi:MAG: GDSL-type esterase/lipase family protein [Acidobacteriota bacterium]
MRIDPELGWTLRPDIDGLASDEPWQAGLRTNAFGFRDVAHAGKAAGVTRVAVLGDSFVFGSGVRQSETLTSRLADLLGPAFEVVNLAVPGYGTDQALLTLRRWGPRLSPDVVLAGFFWNDVMENASSRIYDMEKPRFVPEKGDKNGVLTLLPPGESHGHSAFARLDAFLGRGSHLWSLSRRAFRRAEGGGAPEAPEARPVMLDLSLRDTPPSRSPEFDLTWALLAAIAREARALGATPLVFTIPPRFLVDDAVKAKVLRVYALGPEALDPDGFSRVKEACARRNVPVVDLLPPFRAATAAGEALFSPAGGIHWSAAGQAFAARVLEPAVRDAARVSRSGALLEIPERVQNHVDSSLRVIRNTDRPSPIRVSRVEDPARGKRLEPGWHRIRDDVPAYQCRNTTVGIRDHHVILTERKRRR